MTDHPIFSAPAAPAQLYVGPVMHARMRPKAHRFHYSVFTLLIDIDRLAEASDLTNLFSIGRFNLLSFYEKDHASGGEKLRLLVDRLLWEAGITTPAARILLLCYPRVLGFVFNPISVYFAYDAHSCPIAIIYEVRNTFGQMHSYVAPVLDGELSVAGIRQERDKRFYVSPFLDMPLRYHFRLRPPGDTLALRILETDQDRPMLAASFLGRRQDLTARTIVTACLKIPFMTLKVVLGINWEALKLWLKGLRIYQRPASPQRASFGDPKKPQAVSDWTGV